MEHYPETIDVRGNRVLPNEDETELGVCHMGEDYNFCIYIDSDGYYKDNNNKQNKF